MRFKLLLAAVLCCATQGAVAQSMDQLSGKSAFVRVNLNFLKRYKAVSVYASTKPYCPSVYWYSSRTASNRLAKEGFRKHVNREMKQAGFSAQAIDHCVNNSGFVLENRQLRSHPKNTSYLRFVQSGILVYRKIGTTAIGSMPILAEVHTYGKEVWRVYDGSFNEICAVTKAEPGVNAKCNSFGKLSGHWSDNNDRNTMVGSNSAYEVIFVTERTPSFAKSMFRKTFGG